MSGGAWFTPDDWVREQHEADRRREKPRLQSPKRGRNSGLVERPKVASKTFSELKKESERRSLSADERMDRELLKLEHNVEVLTRRYADLGWDPETRTWRKPAET